MPLPLLVPAVAACCGGYIAAMHESEEDHEADTVIYPRYSFGYNHHHHHLGLTSQLQAGFQQQLKGPDAQYSRTYYRALLTNTGSKTEFQRYDPSVENTGAKDNTNNESKRRSFATNAAQRTSSSSSTASEDEKRGNFGTDAAKPVVTIAHNGTGAEVTLPVTGSLQAKIGYENGKFIEGKVLDLIPPAEAWVVSFCPDSSIIAVGLEGVEGIALYETNYFRIVATIESPGTVSTLNWRHADESMPEETHVLASGSIDGTVSLFMVRTFYPSVPSSKLMDSVSVLEVDVTCMWRVSLDSAVRSMSFVPGEDVGIALAVGEKCGIFSVIANKTTTTYSPILHRIDSLGETILALALSPDGKKIACGLAGGDLKMYDFTIGAHIGEDSAAHLKLNPRMNSAVWSRVGHSENRRFHRRGRHRRELERGKALRYLVSNVKVMQRQGAIRTIVFSNDSKMLFAGGYDKSVIMIDTAMWKIVRDIKHDGTINCMAFDATYRYLAVGSRGDKLTTVYDTSTFHPVKTVQTNTWVTSLSWGSGKYDGVLAIRAGIQQITFMNLQPMTIAKNIIATSDGEVSSVSWSYNGHFLARVNGNSVVISSCLSDFEDVAIATRRKPVRSVCFCPMKARQNLLAAVGDDGFLVVYQMCQSMGRFYLEVLHEFYLENNLEVVAWSTGGTLATGGQGQAIYMLSTPEFRLRSKPIPVEGQVLSIDFIPKSNITKFGEKLEALSMAVGTDDSLAILFNAERYERSLHILRPRTVRCVKYHPTLPFLAIGDNNRVALIDLIAEQVVKEFAVGFRVNSLDFSHCGRFVAVADDCYFTIRETMTFKALQIIPSRGFGQTVKFEPHGQYLALDNQKEDGMILQLGSLLGVEFLPLQTEAGICELPEWALKEAVHRSYEGPSLLQRYMIDGSQGSIREAAKILKEYPEALYTFDRRSGEDCFTTALRIGKPSLLVLVLTTLVDGSLEAENGKRSFLTTSIPEKGFSTLAEMSAYLPWHHVVEVLSKVSFVKVPFSEPIIASVDGPKECASSGFTSPWRGRQPTGKKKHISEDITEAHLQTSFDHKTQCIRYPAVLPLPGLGSYAFLKQLTNDCPPSVFDNDAMGLVLHVMWHTHVRAFFLVDLSIFVFFFSIWIVYVDATSSTTAIDAKWTRSQSTFTACIIFFLNSIFATKELVQSNWGRRKNYFMQLWNMTDLMGVLFVYLSCFYTIADGPASGNIPLNVFGTLALTMKLLSYLRGFHDTGWLISVLRRNFYDVRGFVVVLLAIMVGFTVCFRLLFGDINGECHLLFGDEFDIDQDCDPKPYGSLSRALLSTFELSIVGAYDSGMFGESQFSFLSSLLFVLAVTVILVVALNALIAVLSDSYSRVQESATANQRFERAELIVEYMSIMADRSRKKIEENTLFFHALLEADADGDLLVNKEDWQGGLNALKRDINEANEIQNEETREEISKGISELNSEMVRMQSELLASMQALSAEVQEVRRVAQNANAAALLAKGGRPVTTAVKGLRTIGAKIPIQPITDAAISGTNAAITGLGNIPGAAINTTSAAIHGLGSIPGAAINTTNAAIHGLGSIPSGAASFVNGAFGNSFGGQGQQPAQHEAQPQQTTQTQTQTRAQPFRQNSAHDENVNTTEI